MREKILSTTTNDKIYIYDDVFTYHEQMHFKIFAEQSKYSILTDTVKVHEYNDNILFQSCYSDIDLNNLGIFQTNGIRPILIKHCHNMKVKSSWVTASNHSTKNYIHTDGSCQYEFEGPTNTILYYMNMNWKINDGGETLFCNKNGDIELAVSPSPNRIVVFPSYLGHKAASQDVDANELRFVLVTKFYIPQSIS